MAVILHIETSSKACSVAISRDGILSSGKTWISDNYAHAEKLHHLVKEALSEADCPMDALDAVSISKGPGSYTGLRIGVSAAKGYCYAHKIPLIALDTLEIIARHGQNLYPEMEVVVPMIDARRMEVYTAVFSKGQRLSADQAFIIDEKSMEKWNGQSVLFCGDGAGKCSTFLGNGQELANFYPDASMMPGMAEERYNRGLFEDLAYFEPFYLKDYLPGVSVKNKI